MPIHGRLNAVGPTRRPRKSKARTKQTSTHRRLAWSGGHYAQAAPASNRHSVDFVDGFPLARLSTLCSAGAKLAPPRKSLRTPVTYGEAAHASVKAVVR